MKRLATIAALYGKENELQTSEKVDTSWPIWVEKKAPFQPSEAFIAQVRATAAQHNKFISLWIDGNRNFFIGDDDREHLLLIRNIANSRN